VRSKGRDITQWDEIRAAKPGEATPPGGGTFRAPKYPEGARVVTRDFDPFAPDAATKEPPTMPATLRYIWAMADGGAEQPKRLWIGTEPGGLFSTDDGGDTWDLNEALWNHPSRMGWFGGGRDYPGIHSICVDPRDPNHLHVGISCAGILESTDGGKSWEHRNKGVRASFLPDPTVEFGHDPHAVSACRAHPDVLWQQNHCGIYRSADAGKTWDSLSTEETFPDFGFPIAAHATDPNTAWVVPAEGDAGRMPKDAKWVVCRTEDAGKTWKTLSKGLPQHDSFDVIYRHGLDIAGDSLVMGSTTGNVYYSSDRGDSWECVGNHFPPVYAVRFTTAG
jgi:photosystem II stability/assembly factor-like uncharacterized protein